MKQFFIVVGAVITSFIVIVAIIFLFTSYSGRKFDVQSKAYVDKVILKIFSQWDMEALKTEVSPELWSATSKNEIELVFQTLSEKLGPLKQYIGSKGEAEVYLASKGNVIGNYTAKAIFRKGEAVIFLQVLLNGNKWQIVNFNVKSPVFGPNILRKEIEANENKAKATVTRWASMAENYARKHAGQYPASIEDIRMANPTLINITDCSQPRSGYAYTCKMSPVGYEFTGTPLKKGVTGGVVFSVTTGELLTGSRP